MRYKFENSMDQINQALEGSMNYITDCVGEIDSNFQGEEKLVELGKRLSINLGKKQEYDKKNKQDSNKTVNFFRFFLSKFQEVVKFLVYRSPMISDKIHKYLTKTERANVWKGAIIGEILQVFQIK